MKQEGCNGFCQGSYPFGCAENLNDVNYYHCNKVGGCYYTASESEFVPSDMCTYKKLSSSQSPTSALSKQPSPNPTTSSTPPPSNQPTRQEGCYGYCQGSYPFGCAENLNDVNYYHCNKVGGCYYTASESEFVPSDMCTYKKSSASPGPTPAESL